MHMERYIFVWIVLHISNKEDLVMAKKVVLAGACRTAIGKMGGGLSKTPAPVSYTHLDVYKRQL